MPPADDLSTRGIARQSRRMTVDLADPRRLLVNEAWKALIATALRRNVVVAVGEHRAAIEAAIREADRATD